jgi:LysR family nod box-dependent transcriptional activator
MNLAKYDLNLLIALDVLLEERNVTKAARRLGLSQPAVSSALSRLREMFGDELMVRVGRGFELTSLGCELVEPLRRVLREVEGVLCTRDAFDPATERRMFRIVARDYITFLLLQPLVLRLAGAAPGITVCFSYFDCDSLDLLERDEVDLVIMPPRYQHTMKPARQQNSFLSHPLLVDRWKCAVWSAHPWVGDSLGVEEYLALPHLVFVPGPAHRLRPRVAVSPVDQRRRVAATVESFALMPLMLPGTELVCLIPEMVARRVCEAADIRLLDPPHDLKDVEQSMFWSRHRASDPALSWIREQLCAVAAALQDAPHPATTAA